MDIETKTVIISILETLRQVADTAFEAREMAFKNYVSLRAQPGYAEAYQVLPSHSPARKNWPTRS